MACGDSKDLARKTAADKVLRDKAFNIAKDPKYDGYQRGLATMAYIWQKYAWVVLLKDKKDVSIVNAFQSILKNLIENQISYG